MKLKMKALSPKLGTEIPFPTYATPGAAAMDLRACVDGPVMIHSGKTVFVPTGIAIGLEPGYAALLFPRSGLACKEGLSLANGVGVIDSDYRGEVMVALHNHNTTDYVPKTIQPGDRIAQLAIVPVVRCDIEVVDDLDDTERGAGGFGSTGKA